MYNDAQDERFDGRTVTVVTSGASSITASTGLGSDVADAGTFTLDQSDIPAAEIFTL